MPRLLVILLAALLVVEAVYIGVAAIMTGRWALGAMFGVAGLWAVVDWLHLRSSESDAQKVADRMAYTVMAVLLGVVVLASGWLAQGS